MRQCLATVTLIGSSLLVVLAGPTHGFDPAEFPERGPATEQSTPGESSTHLVESLPEETSLDLDSIPNTRGTWRELVTSADETIHLGMYYTNGPEKEPLKPLASLLEEKARNGVRVRVVSDSVFYSKYPDFLRGFARLKNAEVRILNLKDRTGGVMHAKYMIVDEERYYVGSTNFSWVSLKHNRELGLSGADPDVAADLLSIFATDWTLGSRTDTRSYDNWVSGRDTSPRSTLSTTELKGDTPFRQVVASPAEITPGSVPTTRQTLLRMIKTADEKIFVDVFQYGLTSPYSEHPLTALDFALRRAALRGVQVRLLVSDWSLESPQSDQLKSLVALPGVEAKYLHFPLHSEGYQPFSRVSHTKAMLVDNDLAWIGSENWQPGYFTESRNVGLVTNKNEVTEALRQYVLTAWTSTYSYPLRLGSKLEVPFHW